MIGALTGGAVTLGRFSAIAPDALAVAFSAGPSPTAFGALTLSVPNSVSALAVLGVAP